MTYYVFIYNGYDLQIFEIGDLHGRGYSRQRTLKPIVSPVSAEGKDDI